MYCNVYERYVRPYNPPSLQTFLPPIHTGLAKYCMVFVYLSQHADFFIGELKRCCVAQPHISKMQHCMSL